MTGALCTSFVDLASLTWQRLQAASQTGLSWSEETNTETLLLELRQRHPGEVKIASFTKAQEAKNGADWEWWIGAPGGWLGMRVQAKRISLPKETFRRLQTYQAARQPKSQIETLITSARAEKLNPAYCLYVYSRRWPRVGLWSTFRVGSTAPSSPLGCLVGHAGAIRAVGSDALSKLAPVLFPWHLMVCTCRTSALGTSAAHQAFHLLAASTRAASHAPGVDASDDSDVIDDTTAMFEPVNTLPSYMTRLREVSTLDRPGAMDELMAEARALDRGIRGLVLIRAGDR